MTRKEVVDFIKKGWETLGYTNDRYYDYSPTDCPEKVKRACAIGAGAFAWKGELGYVGGFEDAMHDANVPYGDIIRISDNAGSKAKAIKALEKWAKETGGRIDPA